MELHRCKHGTELLSLNRYHVSFLDYCSLRFTEEKTLRSNLLQYIELLRNACTYPYQLMQCVAGFSSPHPPWSRRNKKFNNVQEREEGTNLTPIAQYLNGVAHWLLPPWLLLLIGCCCCCCFANIAYQYNSCTRRTLNRLRIFVPREQQKAFLANKVPSLPQAISASRLYPCEALGIRPVNGPQHASHASCTTFVVHKHPCVPAEATSKRSLPTNYHTIAPPPAPSSQNHHGDELFIKNIKYHTVSFTIYKVKATSILSSWANTT